MSTVPFTFANQNGEIPLEELDLNFANVKAYANSAGTVVSNTQLSITRVGTLVSLSVAGNVNVGNVNSAYAVTGNTLVISTIDAVDSNVSVISDVAVSGNMVLTGTVTANTFQGNTLDVPRITTNIISSDDSSSIQIQDGIEVYGHVLINGDMTSNTVVTSQISSADSSVVSIEDGLEVHGHVLVNGDMTSNTVITSLISSGDSSVLGINDGLEVYGDTLINGDMTSNTVITSLISSGDSSVLGINDGLEVYGDTLINGNVTADTFISSGNIAVASDARRVVFVSNVAPLVSDGNDGDIWFQY
jgi:hypothetical protein